MGACNFGAQERCWLAGLDGSAEHAGGFGNPGMVRTDLGAVCHTACYRGPRRGVTRWWPLDVPVQLLASS